MLKHKSHRRLQRSACRSFEQLEDRRVLAVGIGTYTRNTDTFSLRNTASAGKVNTTFQLSAPGTIPVVGDWNGDGQDDFGVFNSNNATWSLRYGAETGPANAGVFAFGVAGSLPVVGDWNGDGRDDIGVFEPATATWSLRDGASPGLANAGVFQFGNRNALPVIGDWDGDGRDGIGTVRGGNWRLRQTADTGPVNAGSFTFQAGAGLVPLAGDWNGDGRDGIGVFQTSTAQWSLRQTASAGSINAGSFKFGTAGTAPLVGDFRGLAAPANSLATVVLPAIDLDLLGVEVRTSPITVTLSSDKGDGELLGNLLSTASTLVDLKGASNAVNNALHSTVDLLNSASLNISGVSHGPLDAAPVTNSELLELFVAPVHLDLLGMHVDTSTIRVTLTAKSGQGRVLGNALTELVNLFNPPLPDHLDVSALNDKLDDLVAKLDQQLQGIPSAPVPAVPASDGQILNLTVPPLDLNLLGLVIETSPITVNASAQAGNGALLGNVLTTAVNTLGATPADIAELNTNINEVLAKVVGVLNASNLTLSPSGISGLPPLIQQLVNPTLTAPAAGSTAPVLDLMIASTDGTSPPVDVDLLGLSITTSNIEANLSAQTGDGQVLGNLLYNLANLADPGGPAGLLNLVNLLGANKLNSTTTFVGGSVSPPDGVPADLLSLTLKPLDIDLLGLEVKSDPITVNIATQDGDGKLLGNLLGGIHTLINAEGVNRAINNVLSSVVDLVNSTSLSVDGVGTGTFDTASDSTTPLLDLFVAPVHLDLLGLVATTSPIHLTVMAHSGNGLVLGNVVTELANLFNPPLPDTLNLDDINARVQGLIDRLNTQISTIPSAPTPPVQLGPGEFLQLTVPQLHVNLLGLVLQTSPITVNATASSGNGLLLGNVVTTVLNTVGATPENLTGLNENLNTLLSKVFGVLNASHLVLPSSAIDSLPDVLQTLINPTLIATNSGARAKIVDLLIASNSSSGSPVDVNLLGLNVTTSDIHAELFAETGDGQVLGNLLFNTANLLNPNGLTSLLEVLGELEQLTV
jgi:hypothetical protein